MRTTATQQHRLCLSRRLWSLLILSLSPLLTAAPPTIDAPSRLEVLDENEKKIVLFSQRFADQERWILLTNVAPADLTTVREEYEVRQPALLDPEILKQATPLADPITLQPAPTLTTTPALAPAWPVLPTKPLPFAPTNRPRTLSGFAIQQRYRQLWADGKFQAARHLLLQALALDELPTTQDAHADLAAPVVLAHYTQTDPLPAGEAVTQAVWQGSVAFEQPACPDRVLHTVGYSGTTANHWFSPGSESLAYETEPLGESQDHPFGEIKNQVCWLGNSQTVDWSEIRVKCQFTQADLVEVCRCLEQGTGWRCRPTPQTPLDWRRLTLRAPELPLLRLIACVESTFDVTMQLQAGEIQVTPKQSEK